MLCFHFQLLDIIYRFHLILFYQVSLICLLVMIHLKSHLLRGNRIRTKLFYQVNIYIYIYIYIKFEFGSVHAFPLFTIRAFSLAIVNGKCRRNLVSTHKKSPTVGLVKSENCNFFFNCAIMSS